MLYPSCMRELCPSSLSDTSTRMVCFQSPSSHTRHTTPLRRCAERPIRQSTRTRHGWCCRSDDARIIGCIWLCWSRHSTFETENIVRWKHGWICCQVVHFLHMWSNAVCSFDFKPTHPCQWCCLEYRTGSVLWSIHIVLDIADLLQLVKHHQLQPHGYADDTQIY